MKIGILGTGFGAYHAELYSEMDGIRGIYVFGRNRQKLEEVKRNLEDRIQMMNKESKPQIYITDNADDLLDNNEIQLIDVCLPGMIHREYAVKALRKGKHVFVETPVALNLKDAEEIRDVAAECGRKAFVDLFTRFTGPYVHLKDICRNETYGRLRSFRIHRKTPPIWGDLGPHSIVTNLIIHDIDFITWLMGTPRMAKACCTEAKAGQCAVFGLMQYEDTLVELEGSSMMPYPYPFSVAYEAVFDEAAVRFSEDGYKDHEERSFHLFTQNGKEEIIYNAGNCYANCIKHVIHCIKEDIAPINGIADAVKSLDLALEIQRQISAI